MFRGDVQNAATRQMGVCEGQTIKQMKTVVTKVAGSKSKYEENTCNYCNLQSTFLLQRMNVGFGGSQWRKQSNLLSNFFPIKNIFKVFHPKMQTDISFHKCKEIGNSYILYLFQS